MQKQRSLHIRKHCTLLTIFAKMCSLIFFLSTLYIPPLGGCRKKKKEHIAENKFHERKIEENCRTLTQNQIYKPQQDDNEKEKVSKPNRTTQDDKALMQQASTEKRTTSANAQSASSCQNLHQKRQK
ncbi:MAG: hypothetical protein MR963_03440 [Bacteroidales bacterium]|nr:hypothetical protein [Bacteroidales bacterium]